MNLAILFGARRLILLGFDMKAGTNGETHFHGPHPPEIRRASDYANWKQYFRQAVPDLARAGVEVINCSRETALTCFPRAELRAVL